MASHQKLVPWGLIFHSFNKHFCSTFCILDACKFYSTPLLPPFILSRLCEVGVIIPHHNHHHQGDGGEGRRTIQADRSLLATPRSPLASPFLTFMTEAPASTSPGSPDGPGSPESPSPAPPPQGFGREPRCVSSGLPSRNQMWKSCTGEAWDKPLTDKEGAERGREPQAARQVWHL